MRHTEPAGDPGAVTLLRDAARDALALGGAAGAAALLSRALEEPPARGDRAAALLELGQARARAGAPEAIAPLSEIVERGEDAAAIAAAAIELSGILFFAGRAAGGAAILRRAQTGSRPGSRYASSSRSRCSASATPRHRPAARPTRRSSPCEIQADPAHGVLRPRRWPRSPWKRC